MRGEDLILIVDDDVAIRDSLAEYLELEGYRVVTARNGQDGLERLASLRPALVILDLHMPVVSGAQFLARLRADQQLRSVPVLLMTGSGAHGEGAGLPVEAVLPKPFEIDDLLAAIERFRTSG